MKLRQIISRQQYQKREDNEGRWDIAKLEDRQVGCNFSKKVKDYVDREKLILDSQQMDVNTRWSKITMQLLKPEMRLLEKQRNRRERNGLTKNVTQW
jgi:hypothetical protein